MTPIKVVTRCRVCGRKLTDPVSVKQGIGPVCLKRLERIQKLDACGDLGGFPWRPDTILDEHYERIDPGLEVEQAPEPEPLPTCPGCGKVSPNPNYCPSCGSPMKAKALEVVLA
ncbi:MAG: DUF6011 domain-containing protein [Candidatus Bathyarchaeota archaeon]